MALNLREVDKDGITHFKLQKTALATKNVLRKMLFSLKNKDKNVFEASMVAYIQLFTPPSSTSNNATVLENNSNKLA